MKRATVLFPYDEDRARRVARNVGPMSAAAQALDELERRRKAGEDVYLWWADSSVVVGPVPPEEAKAE